LSPGDALRVAAHDVNSLRPADQVALVAFGAKPVVLVPLTPAPEARFPARIEGVDGSSSDLGAALETAQALAEGGEIVLFSDGRGTAGPVAVERIRVPVHAFALGPLGGVDASIRAIDAPASVRPGTAFQVRVTVEATGAWRGELVSGDEKRSLEFSGPGLQDVVLDRILPREIPDLEVAMRLASASRDLCPENDAATVKVWRESQAPRVLVVSPERDSSLAGAFREPDWIPMWARHLGPAAEADVIVLERLRADDVSREDLDRLARLVREEGAGLVMLGGSSAFAMGGWGGTPVEDLLPFWAFPDERSAVVIVLDRSGSMSEPAPGRSRPRIEEAASAVRRALQLAHDDDEVALVTFADSSDVRCPLVPGRERGRAAAALQGISAGGSTVLSRALDLAVSTAKSSKAGRRHIVLVTDGQSQGDEDAILRAARLLKEEQIGVTIVRTGEASSPALSILREAGAIEIDASDYARLDAALAEAIARSRDLTFAPTRPLSMTGLEDGPLPALLNRVSLKPGAEILGRSGESPAVAVRPAGRGHAAAATFSFEQGWAGGLASWPEAGTLVRRLAEIVAPPAVRLPAAVSARFEGDRLEIAAAILGPERPDRYGVFLDGAPADLVRRGENTYVKTLRYISDTAAVRIGGRIAAVARRPHPPEFDRVGPDEASLDRLASATGGTRLSAPRDLASLPGRGPAERRHSRPALLAAALCLFLLEIAAALLFR
jgi:Mg-chelatase subunit ChlD